MIFFFNAKSISIFISIEYSIYTTLITYVRRTYSGTSS